MKLRDFILRRIILAIPVVFGVLTITWFLAYIVGDPVTMYINENTPAEAIPAMPRGVRSTGGGECPRQTQSECRTDRTGPARGPTPAGSAPE